MGTYLSMYIIVGYLRIIPAIISQVAFKIGSYL